MSKVQNMQVQSILKRGGEAEAYCPKDCVIVTPLRDTEA